MPLSPGSRLGPYEVVGPLGAGGMGEVYPARDTRLGRDVAVKVLPQQTNASPDARQRFEREARAISSLNHPHICSLYDVGQDSGVDFLVLELLEGETLARRLERGPLGTPDLLRIGIELADALDKAHRHGILHRDLKPQNVMLTKSGAKLMDFGLAKSSAGAVPGNSVLQSLSPPTRTTPLTAQGTLVGTFQYMSPEQVEGQDADIRSDIFSFGAVLYEMATGKRAFGCGCARSTPRAHGFYVVPFPKGAGKFLVSAGGGIWPRWSRDGKELWYRQGNRIMSVDMILKDRTLSVGKTQPLFDAEPAPGGLGPMYDASSDGKKFVISSRGASITNPLTLVLNWTALLKRQ